jgi:hypothetical protein
VHIYYNDSASESSRDATRSKRSERTRRRKRRPIRVGAASGPSSEQKKRSSRRSSLLVSLHADSTFSCCPYKTLCPVRLRHGLVYWSQSRAVHTVTSHACTGPIESPRAAVGAHATPLLGVEHARATHPSRASCRPPFSLPLLVYIRANTPLPALYCGPGGRVGNLQGGSVRSTLTPDHARTTPRPLTLEASVPAGRAFPEARRGIQEGGILGACYGQSQNDSNTVQNQRRCR